MPEEWDACLDAWISLAEAHNSLKTTDFERLSAKDESLATFLLSYTAEAALSPDIESFGAPLRWKKLRRLGFLLSSRLLNLKSPPEALISWEYLSDFCKVYGKVRSTKPITSVWEKTHAALEKSLASLKAYLIEQLELGVKGQLKELELRLKRLNHILHSSPDIANFFMNGTDFLDGLVSCYKVMHPPLRKAIITTTYLSLIGLTGGRSPRFSLLTDQLYALKAAADAHKAGPMNERESLVAELVTVTPILKQVQQRIESSGTSSRRAKSVITSLEAFRKAGGGRPKRLVKRRIDKGKGVAQDYDEYGHGTDGQIHIHRMSLITQVQDLFPDLGSGFVMKLLDEYDEDAEKVISHLLDGSLPAHLQNADHAEAL